jgi:hypothetical protein
MQRRFCSTGPSWILGVGVLVALTAGSWGAIALGSAQARSGRMLMACAHWRTGIGNVFGRAPRRCALHFANKPFDGNDIAPVEGIRWSGWGKSVARGRGTFHGNMNYTAPSTIVVSRPRRCPNGTRNYTRASSTTRGIGKFSGPLAACRD